MTSSGVLMSGLMWVIGRQLYISQAQDGHLTRSWSVLSILISRPQSMQTYLPGPGFSPAFAVFFALVQPLIFTRAILTAQGI